MVLLARRGAAALLAPLLSSLLTPMRPLHADTATPATVTDRCRLSLVIGTGEPRQLVVTLYGEAAPASVALFKQLCEGSLGFGSYRGSIATRVEPNKQIVLGRYANGFGPTPCAGLRSAAQSAKCPRHRLLSELWLCSARLSPGSPRAAASSSKRRSTTPATYARRS